LSIKNFAPSWFASVMGTGIVAITCFFYAQHWVWLSYLSNVLFVLNILLFGMLIVPWTLRFILYRQETLRDLREPVTGQFFATMPIACLVLAADLLIIGVRHMDTALAIGLAKGFWLTGVVLALLLAVVIPLLNFISREVKIEQINPAWFMPPVSLIVIPVSGAKLIPYWPDGWQQLMLVFNYVSWSSGFFLFLFLEAICLYRFFCCPPLPGPLAPTIWINLGPIGVGAIALLNLGAASGPFLGSQAPVMVSLLALLLWGFGFWWLICALCLTIYYLRQGNLPFSLAWWAFTFPLGAYAAATYMVGSFINSPAIDLYGFICFLLLLAIWSVVMVRTIMGLVKMEFFEARPSNNAHRS
jgi:C4-dicarboxylate transporter/malic acid transport protein